MTHLIRSIHEELRTARITRRGATHAPHNVPMGQHKEYPRMERIPLPPYEKPSLPLADALQARQSLLQDVYGTPLRAETLSALFGLALGKRGHLSRNYPSGGALFPIETYLIGAALSNPPSVYHYHPSTHALESLWECDSVRDLVPSKDTPTGDALILFTAVWERSSAKYGNLAYIHSLLEAGHMAQNLLLVATALKVAARPIASFDDRRITKLLRLPETENPVYALTLSERT